MVSEKVGGAEGTKLDEDFKDLERVTCKFTSQENICSKKTSFGRLQKIIVTDSSFSRKQT